MKRKHRNPQTPACRSELYPNPHQQADLADPCPSAMGEPPWSEAMALLASFRASFEYWAVEIETLHEELLVLKQQDSVT